MILKILTLVFFCLLILSVIFLTFPVGKPKIVKNAETYPELPLLDRPSWSQWRAEGNGIRKFFLHFRDYQKKAVNMSLNPFPGQREFFARQKQLFADLPKPSEDHSLVHLGFVGDLMVVPNIHEHFIAPQLLQRLSEMDFVLGNLETPVSPSTSISNLRNALSQFNTLPDYLEKLVIKGKSVFHFLSLANNHITDRGSLGVDETVQNVRAKGILLHGADNEPFALYSIKGIRFGIATATWGTNPQLFQTTDQNSIWQIPGIAPLDKKTININKLRQTLKDMQKAQVDFKILYLHWGYEYELYPEPMIQEIGRELIKAGADLVIGSHPHVLQPFELVQTPDHVGLVAYSMGNFVSSMDNPFTRIGLLQELLVWRNQQEKIVWCLGASRFTQVADFKKPQTAFINGNPAPDLASAYTFYQQTLNLPYSD